MTNDVDPVRFGIVAEIHRAAAGSPCVSWHNELLLDRTDELLALAIDRVTSEAIDNLVLLGDLTNLADDESFSVVMSTVADCKTPVLAVPGNHDINEHGALARFGERLRTPGLAVAPAVLQDSTGAVIILIGIERDSASNSLLSSGFPDLSPYKNKPLLVFSHYPLLSMSERLTGAGLKHAGDLSDRHDIEQQLLHHDGPVVVVHGHLHVRASSVKGNILHLSCSALVEPPHEVSFVSIAGVNSGSPVVKFQADSIMTSTAQPLPVFDPAYQERQFADGTWIPSSF